VIKDLQQNKNKALTGVMIEGVEGGNCPFPEFWAVKNCPKIFLWENCRPKVRNLEPKTHHFKRKIIKAKLKF